jgi:hypothetical protein
MAAQTGDVLRVDLVGDINSVDDMIGVYQYQITAGSDISNAELLDDLAAIMTAIVTIIKAFSTAVAVWRRIRVQNITQDVLVGEADFAAPIAGTGTGSTGPNQASLIFNFKTSVPRVILRKYIGPLGEDILGTTGLMLAAYVDEAADYIVELLTEQVGSYGSYLYGYQSAKAGGFIAPDIGYVNAIPGMRGSRRAGVGS